MTDMLTNATFAAREESEKEMTAWNIVQFPNGGCVAHDARRVDDWTASAPLGENLAAETRSFQRHDFKDCATAREFVVRQGFLAATRAVIKALRASPTISRETARWLDTILGDNK